MNKKLLILMICGLFQACTQVDNYLLGKDNSPKPQALKELPTKIKVKNEWVVPAGGSHKPIGYNKRKPVIKNNIAYITDIKGLVQAVNTQNTKIIWSNSLGQEIASGPVVANEIIALGTTDAALIVLDKAKGKKLWQANISSEALANPVITKDKVIVKTIDGNVYAFDSRNGNQLWVVNHGAPELVLKVSSSPVVVGNLLLVGFSDGKLDAIDINTGAIAWQRSIAYASGPSDVERLVDIDADPIVDGQVAYIASYQGLGAISLQDGRFLWQKPASVYKNMTLGANALYVTDSDDVLWSINKSTGKANWKQDALKARGLTEPVLMSNRLIVGDKTGYLHVLALETGELLARSQLSGAIDSAPVATKGKLYVQTANGMLNQLSLG